METPVIPIGPTGQLQNNIAMPYQFTIGNLVQESWQRVRGTKMKYWGAMLICIAIYVALSILAGISVVLYGNFVDPNNTKIPFILSRVIITLITLPLPFGITMLAIYRSVNLPIAVKQVFEPYRSYGKILLIMILIYAGMFLIITATMLGWMFLTPYTAPAAANINAFHWTSYLPVFVQIFGGVVGVYFLYSLLNAPILVVEKQFGVFQAIKTSFLAFSQHGFQIIAAVICMLLICVISAIPFGIGLIWTLPMLNNAMGILYRTQFGVKNKLT